MKYIIELWRKKLTSEKYNSVINPSLPLPFDKGKR